MLKIVRETKLNNLTFLIEEHKLLREKLVDNLQNAALKEELKETIVDLFMTQKTLEELEESKNKILNEMQVLED